MSARLRHQKLKSRNVLVGMQNHAISGFLSDLKHHLANRPHIFLALDYKLKLNAVINRWATPGMKFLYAGSRIAVGEFYSELDGLAV